MAIKVNGTTVINDSRQLQNVASLDATTVAAIGAAGVGGASTLISDNVSVGTGATFTISFSGSYRAYRLVLNHIKPANNYKTLYWRFTNGSGTAITSQAYVFHYQVVSAAGVTSFTTQMGIQERYYDSSTNDGVYMDMTIWNTNESNKATWLEGVSVSTQDNYRMSHIQGLISPHTYGFSTNNSIYFYNNEGGNFANGTYSLWGLN